jgi:hypothetical protein
VLQRKEQHRHANQDPGGHTARHGLQRHQFGGSTGTHHNPHGNHRIEVSRRGVIRNAERNRHPQHQQEAQRDPRAPEHAGSQQRETGFAITPQHAYGVEEAGGHRFKAPGLPRTGNRQTWDKEVCDHRSGIDNGANAQRRQYVPVGQHASCHRAHQNGGDGGGFHQAIGFHQLIARGQLPPIKRCFSGAIIRHNLVIPRVKTGIISNG